jgi:AcrR family transcriptional regulator
MGSMVAFQRARSEEQRAARRQAILDTAAAMLDQMPVSDVSLNELSRRAGLAKSNVLRYFESREAILLELLDQAEKQWLAALAGQFTAGIDPGGDPRDRGDRIAAILAGSVAPRRVLCDLLSAQASVLEHNVSPGIAARYKRATLANITALAALVRRYLPELGEDDSFKLAGMAVVLTGALWSATCSSPSMLAAYDADPALAAMRMDFATALREAVAVLISGALARLPH